MHNEWIKLSHSRTALLPLVTLEPRTPSAATLFATERFNIFRHPFAHFIHLANTKKNKQNLWNARVWIFCVWRLIFLHQPLGDLWTFCVRWADSFHWHISTYVCVFVFVVKCLTRVNILTYESYYSDISIILTRILNQLHMCICVCVCVYICRCAERLSVKLRCQPYSRQCFFKITVTTSNGFITRSRNNNNKCKSRE